MKAWTREEFEFLREHKDDFTLEQFAAYFGRSVYSVKGRMRNLEQFKKPRTWTEEQQQYVIDNYASTSTDDMCEYLGKTTEQIFALAKRLGLKKDKDQWYSAIGRKLKGRKPKCTKKVGHISFQRGEYAFIKVSDIAYNTDGNWMTLQRYVWTLHHGEIPKGHQICFKDGDIYNIDINNLEMVSKKEALHRITWRDYPENMQEIIKLRIQLSHKIKNMRKKLDKSIDQQ